MIKKLLSTTVLLFCCLAILGNNTAVSKTTIPPPSLPKITLCENENIELTAEDAGIGATYEWTKGAVVKSNTIDLIINNVTLADAGTYTLTVTKNGCLNAVDILVEINETPDTPTLNSTAASCATDGTSKITNYDATVTYVFTPTGPTVNTTGEIKNMVVGTSYTVIAEKLTCQSNNSVAFKNDGMLPTPNIPTLNNTAASCATDGANQIDNYDATVTYVFTPVGPTVNATGEIQNMVIGTSYTVIAKKGTCQSNNSASFKNDVMLPTPKAIIKLK
ncbi:immunoglobulin domain-containing protein [Tenacibaculum ovolyticum]|uniref:immunoglobulin domain-containing protein n=1 Tax=Tenacibaculum ovolyticum TaxID=104270 RepID=UPI0007EDB3C7|nr:immunoglobulin domain-containing protein [Tenacibaculum ovolyticum]